MIEFLLAFLTVTFGLGGVDFTGDWKSFDANWRFPRTVRLGGDLGGTAAAEGDLLSCVFTCVPVSGGGVELEVAVDGPVPWSFASRFNRTYARQLAVKSDQNHKHTRSASSWGVVNADGSSFELIPAIQRTKRLWN